MERKSDIDIAKAIGIIMVVWAHAGGPFSSYINQFHMPFFFFLSGILFHMPDDYKEYVLRKIKTLLIPFWKWNFLLLLPFWLLYFWGKWEIRVLRQYAVEIGITVNKVPMLGATWFLPALFWTCVIFAGVKKVLEKINIKNCLKDVFLLLYGGISCCVGMYCNFPYRISRNLVCSLFFVLGYLYSKYVRRLEKNQIVVDFFACSMGVIYWGIASHNKTDLGGNEYKWKFLFVIGAVMASYAVLIFSRRIASIRVWERVIKHLRYLGKNTMPIVIWHFVFFRIAIVLQIITMEAPLGAVTSFPIYYGKSGWWIIYIVCGIYGSLVWNKVLETLKIKCKDI